MKSIDVELRSVKYIKTPYYFIEEMHPIGFDKEVSNPKDKKVYKLVKEMISKKQVVQSVSNAYFSTKELEIMYEGNVHILTNKVFPKELKNKRIYYNNEVIAEHNGKEGWIRLPSNFDNFIEVEAFDLTKTSLYRVVTNTAIECEGYSSRVVCEALIPRLIEGESGIDFDGTVQDSKDVPFVKKVVNKHLSQNNDVLVSIQDEFEDADILLDTLVERGYGVCDATIEVNRVIGLLNWDITEKTFIQSILKVLKRPCDFEILSLIPPNVRCELHPNDTLACDEFVGMMDKVDW